MYLFCPQANCSLSLSFVCVFFPFFFKVFIGVQLLYWSIVPGGGNGNPLQCSRLDNPMDRGAWRTTVQGVTKSRKRLSTAHRAALQCCVSLCCKTKWTRYMYTHILSFGDPRLCHHGALGTAACAIQKVSTSYLFYRCCSVVSESLWPYGLQHTRLPCPLLSPGVGSNSGPLSQWCHPTIIPPFSSCPQ